MFGFGHTPELVILLVIAVIILGPKRLPEVGRGLGKMIGNFKHETAELRSEATSIRDEFTSMKDVVKDDPKRETSAAGQARSQ